MFFDNSTVFQRPFGIQKVLQNPCLERQHRVSGLFLKGAKSTKCPNLIRASRFRPVLQGAKSGKCVNLTRASCFRPVFEGCRINEICEFDKSFAFQSCFWHAKHCECNDWTDCRVCIVGPLYDSYVKCVGSIVILNN